MNKPLTSLGPLAPAVTVTSLDALPACDGPDAGWYVCLERCDERPVQVTHHDWQGRPVAYVEDSDDSDYWVSWRRRHPAAVLTLVDVAGCIREVGRLRG